MPFVSDHLIAEVQNLELQGFSPQRVTALGTPGDGAATQAPSNKGILRYLLNDDAGQPRDFVYYYSRDVDGTTPIWKRASAPWKDANGDFADFPVTQDHFVMGSVNGKMGHRAKTAIPLSGFGVPEAGIAMGGQRITGLPLTPGADLSEAASVNYVQTMALGLQQKTPVKLGSTQALPGTWTYNAGAGTLTRTTNGALASTDVDTGATGGSAYVLATNDRILLKDEATQHLNGIWVVTNLGSGGSATVLTRATDSDTDAELRAAMVFIEAGSLAGQSWNMNAAVGSYGINPGSGAITWVLVSDATQYTGGPGITVAGTTISFHDGTWAAGTLFVGAAGNTLTELLLSDTVAGTTSGRILQQDGSAVKWSKFTFPHGASGDVNRLLYFSSTTAVSTVTNANNGVLITNGSGVPSVSGAPGTSRLLGTGSGSSSVVWLSSLPFTVALGQGGTNADLSAAGGTGSVAYKSGSAIALGSTPGASGDFAYWDGSKVAYYDLFDVANTWTGQNTWQANMFHQPASPGTNGTFSDSPRVSLAGAGRNGSAVVTWNRWDFYVDVTDSAGAGSLRLLNDVAQSPNPTAIRAEWYTSGAYGIGGDDLIFRNQSGTDGTLRWQPSAATVATIPNTAGVNFTLAGLEIAQTWSGQQDHLGSGTALAWAARVTGDHASAQRWYVQHDGKHAWGAGGGSASPADVTLHRSGASTLTLTGNLVVTGNFNGGTWAGGVIGTTYGGTGANLSASAYGVVYRTNGSPAVFAVTAAGTANYPLISNGASSAPGWASYALPGALPAGTAGGVAGAQRIPKSTNQTTLGWLDPVADRVLLCSSTGVVDWTGVWNPSRTTGDGTSGGVARKFSSRKAGDGTTEITVTHNLGTYDVIVGVRRSDAANDVDTKRSTTTGIPYRQVFTGVEVISKDAVKLVFANTQTASDYYVITVVA